VTVFVNFRSVVHKGDGLVNVSSTPDVCKTPGPSGPVPVPYPNIAKDADLTSGTTSVEVLGNSAAIEGACLALSTGDEAGTAGGVISNINLGKMTWLGCSLDVQFEGKGVIRFADVCLHNGNTPNAGGQPQLGATAPAAGSVNPTCSPQDSDVDFFKPAFLALIPRRADRIFTKQVFPSATSEAPIVAVDIRNRLPHWRRHTGARFILDEQQRIKGFEHRLYIDFATQVGGRWLAQRKLSVVCLYRRPLGQYLPAANVPVTLTRSPAGCRLQFKRPDGTFADDLTGAARPTTNGQGIAEITIAHPTVIVPQAERSVEITASADVPELGRDGHSTSTTTVNMTATLIIRLARNDEAARVEDVYDDPAQPDSADRIWAFQPTAPEPRSDGIRRLQEALNEVVSRHRAVPLPAPAAGSTLIELNGVFNDETRKFVSWYLEHFVGVHAGGDYPYELRNIGPDPDLLTYVQEDYVPFDPRTTANRGRIVDRRFLVGESRDNTPAQIDGLWELYEGVVLPLQQQARAYGQTYLDCDRFWLHRPIHTPYVPGPDQVFVCGAAGLQLRVAPAPAAALLQQNGAPVGLADGEHLLVTLVGANPWVQVRHAAGLGWVRVLPATGRLFHNDAGRYRVPDNIGAQVANSGLYGIAGAGFAQDHTLNGVAYTYGGKQTPDQWRESLRTNPRADPDHIVHYDEYGAGHRFGEIKGEHDVGDITHMQAGCDCSGFVQNCILHAVLPGTNTPIVPRTMIGELPQHPIGAGGLVPGHARRVATANGDRNWVRAADLVCTDGHVVMIAEDMPNLANPNFKIMHEWGGCRAGYAGFTRKSIRSPFSWYLANLAAGRFGKVFIWR